MMDVLGDQASVTRQPAFCVERADDAATIWAYRSLRTNVFVHEQGLYTGHDLDAHDEDPRTVVLLTADEPGGRPLPAGPAVSVVRGELVTGSGVTLRRPDGEQTRVILPPSCNVTMLVAGQSPDGAPGAQLGELGLVEAVDRSQAQPAAVIASRDQLNS